jgi:hypothetical protein
MHPLIQNIFFDATGGRFFLPRDPRGWIVATESQVKRFLQVQGIPKEEIPALLNHIVTRQAVDYAGPYAGKKVGRYSEGGREILVTHEAELITPAPGNHEGITNLLRELLTPPDGDPQTAKLQLQTLFGWLKVAVESLACNYRPGQALVLVGSRGCGKTLALSLITKLLGGRVASPYGYMTKSTDFNGELAGAELLLIDDEVASTDIRARRALGQSIKTLLYAGNVRIHPKGRSALSLRPWWRLAIAANDGPEDIAILPPLDESLEDKIIGLQCGRVNTPPLETLEERRAFMEGLEAELPALAWKLSQSTIPEALSDRRNGVRSFIHPHIRQAVAELSPEEELWQLIRSAFTDEEGTWTFTAAELERELVTRGGGKWERETRRLLSHTKTAGRYLGRLAITYPDKVQEVGRRDNTAIWEITPRGKKG